MVIDGIIHPINPDKILFKKQKSQIRNRILYDTKRTSGLCRLPPSAIYVIPIFFWRDRWTIRKDDPLFLKVFECLEWIFEEV